jgi:hypothetical protein
LQQAAIVSRESTLQAAWKAIIMTSADRLAIATSSLLALALSACSGSAAIPASPTAPFSPAAVPVSPTADACSPENLPASVMAVNDHMRQFDAHAELASNIVQSQVVLVIPPMQEIRRSAADQTIGPCLANLKSFQLQYMDVTLQTLQAFQEPAPDPSMVASGILKARQYHDQYAIEMARLLGVTLGPPAGTPTP